MNTLTDYRTETDSIGKNISLKMCTTVSSLYAPQKTSTLQD